MGAARSAGAAGRGEGKWLAMPESAKVALPDNRCQWVVASVGADVLGGGVMRGFFRELISMKGTFLGGWSEGPGACI